MHAIILLTGNAKTIPSVDFAVLDQLVVRRGTRAREWTTASRPAILGKAMKTVAIIGASNNRNKYGNKAVRAFLRQGYTVYPVNLRETKVEGLPAFQTVQDVPVRPEKISVYLPPPLVLQVLPEIAARGCDELWLNPGTESEEVPGASPAIGP